jgi:hypothetical protein
VRTSALLGYGILTGLSLLLESDSLFRAAVCGQPDFVMPHLGDLGEKYDAAALVIGVYYVRRFGIAAPVAHTCV